MYLNPRKMLSSLSIGFLLFTYAVYLTLLFGMGDAIMSWLLIGVAFASALLFCSALPASWAGRRAVLNALIIVNGFSIGFGTLLALSIEGPFSTVLSLVAYGLLAFSIAGLYRTSLAGEAARNVKMLHALNITIGLTLTAGTLFFLYVFYLFSEDGSGAVWKLFVPLGVYIPAYIIQMKTVRRHKNTAYTAAVVQTLMPFLLIGAWFLTVGGEGG